MITCPTCKGQFLSYPEFTAHIGNPGCANEVIAAPALEHLPLRSLTEAADANASLGELTCYQANVFIVLNNGLAGKRFGEEVALDLIAKYTTMITERDRRNYKPLATARAIIEAEADSVRLAVEGVIAGSVADTVRLDWLETFIETGLIETGLELEGGIHLTLSRVGDGLPIAYREQNSLREAIDAAMKDIPSNA